MNQNETEMNSTSEIINLFAGLKSKYYNSKVAFKLIINECNEMNNDLRQPAWLGGN